MDISANLSNLVPIRKGMAVLLNPLACLYHSCGGGGVCEIAKETRERKKKTKDKGEESEWQVERERTEGRSSHLDAVESGLPGEVKHEEDGHGVVADEREHIDKLLLATEIPDGEGDFGVANGDGLLHEIHSQGLRVLLIVRVLHVLDHQTKTGKEGVVGGHGGGTTQHSTASAPAQHSTAPADPKSKSKSQLLSPIPIPISGSSSGHDDGDA